MYIKARQINIFRQLSSFMLALGLLMAATILAFAQETNLENQPPFAIERQPLEEMEIDVRIEISQTPFDDTDWPIVKVETNSWRDEHTDEIVTQAVVVRELRTDDGLATYDLHPDTGEICSESDLLSYCYVNGERTMTAQTSRGGITAYVKHRAYRVCRGGPHDCDWHEYRELNVWWTRTNGNWYVADAQVHWGCYACLVCPDGTFGAVWASAVFTPSWQNDTSSVVYTYISSTWPRMKSVELSSRASSDSKAYNGSQYWGLMSVNAGFN